jgi:hypothetical protein
VVAVLAALQAVSPVLFDLPGSTFLEADRPGEPAIVPAGYAFAIWGLRLAAPLAVVFAVFSLWLLAVVVEPRWTPLVIFVVMVVALLRALRIALDDQAEIPGWSRLGRGLP